MTDEKLKKGKMLLLLGLLGFLANGDNYAVAPMLNNIAYDLGINISSASLSVTSYMLFFGLFTIIFGPLGDRFGKTKIINIAAFGTAIFSTLAAFSFSLSSLIIFRAINGAFAAGVFPVTMALIGETFDDENRQGAIGKIMGMMFLGAASATVIGGTLSYLGSWRMVYALYGIAELIIAFIMLKKLERIPGVIDKLSFRHVYGKAFQSKELVKTVSLIFLIGFAIFGSFTFAGSYVAQQTGLNVFYVGLILTFFGIATLIGGKKAPKIRKKLKSKFLLFAGVIGAISLFALAYSNIVPMFIAFLFGFGLAFVFLQTTMIMHAQHTLPHLRGTAMSMASFNMFVGGAVGTFINGQIIDISGFSQIFINASVILLIASFLATRVVFPKKDLLN